MGTGLNVCEMAEDRPRRTVSEITTPTNGAEDWCYVSESVLLELVKTDSDTLEVRVHDGALTVKQVITMRATVVDQVCAIRGWRRINTGLAVLESSPAFPPTTQGLHLIQPIRQLPAVIARWFKHYPTLEFLVQVRCEWLVFWYRDCQLQLIDRRFHELFSYYLTDQGIAAVGITQMMESVIYPPGRVAPVMIPLNIVPFNRVRLWANRYGFLYAQGSEIYYGRWAGGVVGRGPIDASRYRLDGHHVLYQSDPTTVVVDNLLTFKRRTAEIGEKVVELIGYREDTDTLLLRTTTALIAYDMICQKSEELMSTVRPCGLVVHWYSHWFPDSHSLITIEVPG